MIKKMIRFFRGSVTLEVTSAYVERFLNMCWAGGVEIWGIRRLGEDRIRAGMSVRNYLRVKPFAEQCMCSVKITETSGIAHALSPFRKRYFLIASAFICAFVCFLSTRFLWRVTISGCESISQREIWNQLSDLGLRTGKLCSSIDTNNIKLELMSMRDDIAYVTINMSGTEAYVSIVERDMNQQIVPEKQPCDIISDKTGVIENMQVLRGDSKVSVGDAVVPGDLLVSGTITSSQGETRLIGSMADITLKTYRKVKLALSREIYGLDETGAKRVYYSIIIGRRRIEMPLIEKMPFACYYKTKETLELRNDKGFSVPVALVKETYYECTPRLLELSENACAEILEQSCADTLAALCQGGEVKTSGFEYYFGEDSIYGVLSAECVEKTGTERAIQ
ncbi:MAG: sporulation protein YqfD [Clostridiaceae bacterium]|nr:sporulation protein YqfD [Clostridiaceae bacterium]